MQLYSISFLPWDSIPYVFQGKWFCGEQTYLELIRPPVPGFFNCLFGAQLFSIVISTGFASILYLAGLLLLYKKSPSSYDQFTLALFAFLFPPILFLSNFGSDLFALAFLILAFAVASPAKKGLLFGLSSLSRYNFLVFIVVILWQMRKEPKKIPVMLGVAVATWVPWMVFNYFYSGDPFFSINESTYLNVLMKGASAPISTAQFAVILIFLATVLLLGFKKFKDKALSQSAIINFGQFVLSAVKETRFINLITPALAFNISELSKRKFLYKIIFIIIFVFSFVLLLLPLFNDPVGYYNFVFHKDEVPKDSFLYQCKVASDKWVLFYPHGIVAQYLPGAERYNEYLDKGAVLVVYNYKEVDLNKFSNVINRGEYVIIKPQICAPQIKRYISGSWNYKVFSWIRDHNYLVSDLRDWPE
ncbi:MAG: hypothetical protein WCI04_01360 [archaeon]